MDEAAEITGRDDFIIAKALYYAIKYIDSLPPPERELSDQNDMQMILNERFPVSVRPHPPFICAADL